MFPPVANLFNIAANFRRFALVFWKFVAGLCRVDAFLYGFWTKGAGLGGELPLAEGWGLVWWCMMWATGKTFMSNAALTRTKSNWTVLNKQLAQARTLLRQMRETVEDIEDARTIERAKRANGNKQRIPWSQVKKELQLD
ncbi:MAG: hypothetical protein QOJ40_1770 [Verrucomicrobiota bacterium]